MTDHRDASRQGPFSLATGGGLLTIGPAATDEGATPETIGTYRILEPLGEGGMGMVYLAEQIAPVERKVALKVLRSSVVSKTSIIRFEAERQAMARLSHPNIAQMFEAGTGPDNHPYFVMEYVPGEAITDFCDRWTMSIDARLALFRAVLSGVQHAHEKGILHRDIKPSNIMVTEIDGKAVPKIIDFGIAKAIDRPLSADTLKTGEGLIGTLGFLSPEALLSAEDVDTRCDVYALGILLHELLIGVRPFDHDDASMVEVIRRIVEDDAQTLGRCWSSLDAATRHRVSSARAIDAGRLSPRLVGDLEWVVAKAIAKERQDRYPSAAELSAEIGRHLRHEPVEAGPPGGLYRARKLIRRHRGPVLAATLLVLTLGTGLVFRTLEARRANREAEAARQVTQLMVGMFEVADPMATTSNDITARELLRRGAARIAGELQDQPLVRAQLLDTIATALTSLGDVERAADLATEALEIRRARLAAGHPGIASSLDTLGFAALRQGHFPEAEALLAEAVAVLEAHHGPQHLALARPLRRLGRSLSIQDRFEEAEAHIERALALQEAELGPRHLEVSHTLTTLGFVRARTGRYREAEAAHQRALEIREAELGGDHALVSESLVGLTQTASNLDQYPRAVEYSARALGIREAIYGTASPELNRTLIAHGDAFMNTGRYDEAQRIYQRSLAIARASDDVDPREVAKALGSLATVAWRRGDPEQCIDLYQQANVAFEALLGAKHTSIAWNHSGLGLCQHQLRRFEAAEASFLEAHRIFAESLGIDHHTTAVPLQNLAGVYIDQGKLDAAEATYRKNLATWENALGPDHNYVSYAAYGLGDVYRARKEWTEAERWFRRSLEIRDGTLEAGDQDLHLSLKGLATVLRATDRAEEAAALEARIPTENQSIEPETGAGDA